jgi:hypothetical protein
MTGVREDVERTHPGPLGEAPAQRGDRQQRDGRQLDE